MRAARDLPRRKPVPFFGRRTQQPAACAPCAPNDAIGSLGKRLHWAFGATLVFLANASHRPATVALQRSASSDVAYTDLITNAGVEPASIDLATDQVMLLRGG